MLELELMVLDYSDKPYMLLKDDSDGLLALKAIKRNRHEKII